MSKFNNIKKTEQLGISVGTASNRLRKSILFNLVKRLKENFCFQCGLEILTEDEFSIEHKIPYLDSENPSKLFFDLDNIAYSHLDYNCRAARPRQSIHPSASAYKKGCRCEECRKLASIEKAEIRSRKL